MDNRIPSVIKDFVKQEVSEEIEGLNHLTFVDWIGRKEHLVSDWTIIARYDNTKDEEHYSTISCFASPPKVDTKEVLFSKETWDVKSDFGIPYLDEDLNGEWCFYTDVKKEKEHVTLKPFVIRRNFSSYIPSRFELIQHFILFYGAFWVEDKKEYQTIEESGEIISIIKHNRNSEKDEVIYINTRYLRNYLSLTKSYLVRFHDHRRKSKHNMPFDNKEFAYKDTMFSFRINVSNTSDFKDFISFSRLLGKDIIEPFNKPILRFFDETEEQEYASFIYGVNENGENIESLCNEKSLSNYNEDTGRVHFLTPVFFSKSVLLKYYSEPKKYIATSHNVECLCLWEISIDITIEGVVQVWLGDLGRLPYKEQLHWKQYNVQPIGTISKHRFENDFEAKFSSPSIEESPIYHLINAYNELNVLTEKLFLYKIFLELTKDDTHYIKTLRIPLTEELLEFDQQILAMAKIFCDSLNIKLLEGISKKKIGVEIKGTIALLSLSLEKIGISTDKVNLIVEAFQAIQSIRSAGTAHRKGGNFRKALEKYNLNSLTNENKIKELTIRLYNSIQMIIQHLQK